MGLLGPLTAQALGRSPFDDVVSGEEGEGGSPPQQEQQYDHRGRPINPESKRINRDIIRAHNEVMLVVGVAEPENPQPGPDEQASKGRHFTYEEAIGTRLVWATKRCVEAVGVFGLTGTRQRILIYQRYATTPLWETYQSTWANLKPRDILAGAPTMLLSQYIGRRWFPPWAFLGESTFTRKMLLLTWSYTRAHLELFAALQRLGLVSATQILPSWRYFIPFSSDSPIPAPPPLQDFSTDAMMRWAGAAFVSAIPFIFWLATQQLIDEWRPRIWQLILTKLPSPIFDGKSIYTFETPPFPPSEADEFPDPPSAPLNRSQQDVNHSGDGEERVEEVEEVIVTSPENESTPEQDQEPEPTSVRRQSLLSGVAGGGEDFESEEDTQELNATLISFDVEATDSTEVPQGLWSAELRPSHSDSRSRSGSANAYLSTMLTRLPSLMAAQILNDQILRLLSAPIEMIALRCVAHSWHHHHGGLVSAMLGVKAPWGFTLRWLVNFLKQEFVHLSICAEILAAASGLAYYYHMSEEEWRESGGNDWGAWLGISSSTEPLF